MGSDLETQEMQDNMHRLIFEYPMSLIQDKRLLGDLPGFLPAIECVCCSEVLNLKNLKDKDVACGNCGKILTRAELEILTKYVRAGLRLLDSLVGGSSSTKQGKGLLCSILRVLRLKPRSAALR